MSYCAPNRKNGLSTEKSSCFTLAELIALCKAWNATKLGSKNPIHVKQEDTTKDESTIKLKLWQELKKRFYPYCKDNESCWLDNVELNSKLKKLYPAIYDSVHFFSLKPKGTKGKNDWLSTLEIDYIMKQYENMYTDFSFIGCLPSDYFILNPERFPKKVLDTKAKAGIIFNLDETHQNGSHWVALFFEQVGTDLLVEYFDPTGQPPNKNIKQFLSNRYFNGALYIENKKEHQRGNNECGSYSLFFIICRLKGKTFDEINDGRIPDTDMNKLRSIIFRPFSEKWSAF